MALNAKSEMIRKERKKPIRQLSAAATIDLLREERAKGKLSITSDRGGADPFSMLALIEYMRGSHRILDFSNEDLSWFEQILIELIEELHEHKTWPYYITQPQSLRETAESALWHFELGDVSVWMKFVESGTNKHEQYRFEVSAFLAMAKRPRAKRPDDDRMSDFLVSVLDFLGVGEDGDPDNGNLSFEVGWFKDLVKSNRMRSRMVCWFNKARVKLPKKMNKEKFDQLVTALHLETKQS